MQNRIKYSGIVALLLAISAQLQAATLLPYRSSGWKYFLGTAEASDPSEAWRANGFNDAAWTTGNAPVGYPSDGAAGLEASLQTTLATSTAGGYTCVFLRKTFVVNNPAEITSLTLQVQYDDGYVAWVNGVEIGRAGVADPISRTSLAGDHEVTGSEGSGTLITSTPGLLVAGTNVVAIQVFNSGAASSDLFLDATLSSTLDEAPTIFSIDPPPTSIMQALTIINVAFTENVTGVNAADLLINSVPATNVIQNNPRDYTFQFSQPATGAVTVAWTSNPGINDIDGAPNAFVPGGPWTYTLDPNVLAADAIISEFMADNENGIEDEDGTRSDWLEIYNPGLVDVSLNGWYLTDNHTNLTKWRMPNFVLGNNKYLLIWASEKNRTDPTRPLHTNFRLSRNARSYLALVKPDGITVVSSFGTNDVQAGILPPYPAQQTDISFGRDRVDPNLTGFFVAPTPGAQNTTSGTGFAAAPDASHESGVYTNASISFVISNVPGTTIRYTTDGSVPTNTSTVYTGPINVQNNTTIKYRAFPSAAGLFPSPVKVLNFVFLDASTRDFNSNLPVLIISTEGRAMNQGVAPGFPRTKGTFVVFDTFRGRSSLARKPDYVGPADFEVFGQTSAGFPKQPYNVELQDDLGNDKAESILGMPAEADWKLRNPYADKCLMNDFLAYEMFEQMGNYSCRRKLVEVFVDTGGQRLTYPGDYIGVEVFLEKIERGDDRVDIAELTPFHTTEPDISGGWIFKDDKDSPGDINLNVQTGGNIANTLKIHEPKPQSLRNVPSQSTTTYVSNQSSVTNYTPAATNQLNYLLRYLAAVNTSLTGVGFELRTGTNHYSNYLDVDTFVDQHWVVEFPKQIDGYRISNFLSKDRGGKIRNVPIWDWNLSFGNADYLEGGLTNGWYYTQAGPADHTYLRSLLGSAALPNAGGDPDFIQKVIDRWGTLRTNIMNADRVLARIDEIANLLQDNGVAPNPVTRNFSKYNNLGTYLWPNPPGSAGNTNAMHVNYWVGITSYGQIIEQMKKWTRGRFLWVDGQFPKAPTLSLTPGPVTAGSTVTMNAPAGTIYYTLDGTDPRQSQANGAVAAGAQTSAGPITINANARVFARARNGTVWSPPTIATYVVQTPQLVITEIMYHPQDPPLSSTNVDSDFEYIELKNIGASTLSLNGYSLSNAVDFVFPNVSLNAGQRILVVANQAAFTARYGAGYNIAGQFSGNLNNAGDRVVLEGRMREPILDFTYLDEWHPITDGFGFSLVIVNENAPASAWGTAAQWRPSGTLNGTPGQSDDVAPTFPQVVINEALTHSDPPPPTDTIELRNLGGTPAAIGGWFLTDDFRTPKKYQIANGTTIPANGYLTFNEAQFNTNTSALIPFSLSSQGEEVYLFSADAAGNLTGYQHGFAFGAAKTGVTFGRHVTSTGEEHFVSQASATLGAANSGLLIGPVVISEIMYRPQDVLANGAYWNNSEDEFIELHNISGTNVALFDAVRLTNTWRLDRAVEFSFPLNTSIPAGGYLLVVNFNPATDTAQLNAFRAKFGISAAVPLVGPYKGSLDNQDEALALYMPDVPETVGPDAGVVPYVLVDQVSYGDQAPWPVAADGMGHSLQRLNDSAYGDDPMNWAAGVPRPAAAYVGGPAPTISLNPVNQTIVSGNSVMFSGSASGTGPLAYQWRFNGGILNGATNSVLMLPSVGAGQAGMYQLVALNPFGSAVSSEATLTVLMPASITVAPADVRVRVRPDPAAAAVTNATFQVSASSSTALHYQWRRAGTNLPGATSTSLTITNVQVADDGEYSCAITDDVGTIFTQPVKLLPLVTPVIVQAPLTNTVPQGGLVSVSVALGDGNPKPFYYEWRRGSPAVAKFTNDFKTNVFTFVNTNAVGTQQYRLVVTNLANATPTAVSTVFNIITIADTDRDGMSDEFEIAHGLNTNDVNDAAGDLDLDTMTNLEESLAGTDPADANSYLRVDNSRLPGLTVLQVAAVSNRTYSVQYTDSLSPSGASAWNKAADIVARPTNRVETLTVPNAAGWRFWRIVLPAQP